MERVNFKDAMGHSMSIQGRECPICKYPNATAMVDDYEDQTEREYYYVAWCPCGTIFELNDYGKSILAKPPKEKEIMPEWWIK